MADFRYKVALRQRHLLPCRNILLQNCSDMPSLRHEP